MEQEVFLTLEDLEGTIDDKPKKDKEVFLFNPITGELDLALRFNEDRIVTHSNNLAGNPLVVWDESSSEYVPMDDLVVTDDKGNVVVV